MFKINLIIWGWRYYYYCTLIKLGIPDLKFNRGNMSFDFPIKQLDPALSNGDDSLDSVKSLSFSFILNFKKIRIFAQ